MSGEGNQAPSADQIAAANKLKDAGNAAFTARNFDDASRRELWFGYLRHYEGVA